MKFVPAILSVMMALATPQSSVAHEFWIDPAEFMVAPDGRIEAQLRVGQDFQGGNMAYLPRNFTRFDVAFGDTLEPVEGRMGDRPALAMNAPDADGLLIVLHEASDAFLTYDEWARFVRFVEHKDFDGVLERHAERGLPETGFTEAYSRHVKSLIAVGEGLGHDRAFGLRTEFVALANPYTDNLTGGFPVQLFLNGEPRANAQVELWDRAPDNSVSVTVHRTDATGIVTLPVAPGHVYMADAVAMEEIAPEPPRNVVWHSIWASLTFAVP